MTALIAFPMSAAAMPSEIPDSTWAPNGRVSAIVQVGDTIILGGTFTEIRDGGGYGANALPRNNIAAFNATTKTPLSNWAPNVNGSVQALVPSADETRVFLGGKFTNISGSSRGRLAAVSVATGAVDTTFKPPAVGAEVKALAVAGSKVYAGGQFEYVGGSTGPKRARLAAFDATTGVLDPIWTPAADHAVYALAVSADRARIFAGGAFDVVSGLSRLNLAKLSASDGAVDPAWHPDPNSPVLALATTATGVFAAGGGSANAFAAYDPATGSQRWIRHSNGDFQAVAVSGNIVYAGGHYDTFEGELRRKLVALDTATGALRKAWKPIFPTSSAEWGGIWALSAHAGRVLAVGGDFMTVSAAQQQHYAQFTGSIDGSADDITAPETPGNVTASALGGSTVNVEWSASTDDDAVASYDVFRDGNKIGSTETSTFTDGGVSPNTTYSYRVVARDFAGHASSQSAAASVTTAPPDQVLTFAPTDDATIDASLPNTNTGSSSRINIDKDPLKDFLLKFNLSGLAGRQVISAKLRLNCVNASTNGGRFRRVTDNSWSQGTVTWNNAPAAEPVVTAALDDVLVGQNYDVDVTPLVKANGTLSLRTSSGSADGADFSSKEGAAPPKLTVRLADPSASGASQPLFADGFESGDLSRWTERNGMAIRHGDAASGAWSVRATSNGEPQYVRNDLRSSETDVWTSIAFKQIARSADSTILQRLRLASGASLMRLSVSATGKLVVRNDVSGKTGTDTTTIPLDTWHTAQAHVVVAGATSRIDVWLDGKQLNALTITDGLGTAPITGVQLGDDAAGKTFDVGLDDFSLVASASDTTAPTAPTGLTASAPAPYSGQVNLSWQAAQDNFQVTQYQVYRDGALLATTGNVTTYADTTAAAATAYSYTVRALDGAGNASPMSAPASVTTPGPDTTAPTVPGGVTATAISSNRVDVAWKPSSDDTAVASYRVFRDGTLLTSVGAATTRYSDASVAASTTYSYTVRALDSSGNASGESVAASATTPAAALFQDGFESGDLSQWTTASGLTVQQSDTFAGAWAVRAATTGQAAYASKTLATEQPDLVMSTRVKIVNGGGTTVSLLKLRRANDTSLLRIYTGSTGKLALRNDASGVATTSSTLVTAGAWHQLQVHVVIGTLDSQVEVFLDGVKIDALSQPQALGTTPVGRLQIGDDTGGKTYTMLFDDVVAAGPPA
ncbi:MAG TPA: DNRLRE domain-containing protein [Acidimicrobiia bacterium]|nr:DNRLRE domain-containing protein [Acidimicrobiia bacterium]